MVNVDRLTVEEGTVELDRVHLVSDGKKVTVGKPTVKGAKVIADVVEQGICKRFIPTSRSGR